MATGTGHVSKKSNQKNQVKIQTKGLKSLAQSSGLALSSVFVVELHLDLNVNVCCASKPCVE